MTVLIDHLNFDPVTKKHVNQWLNGNYDDATKNSLNKMLGENPQEVIDSFYTTLSFGTGGMRGVVGIGTNRFNVYTVRAASQGLANYINKQPKNKIHAIAIGYDSRNQSRLFAEETAKVMAGNGIQVYLFKDLRPTPLVSFACRFHHCISGVMITASHNPPEYNGFKVFWNNGAQVLSPHDQGIISEVQKITELSHIQTTKLNSSIIHVMGAQVDEAYIRAIDELQYYPEQNRIHGKKLKIIYSNLHGTGITILPQVLNSWGFTDFTAVKEQEKPDGHFPTVRSPNPEETAALELGIALLKANQADLLIATDPDADRVGVAVDHEGEIVLLTGNEIASLCAEHICHALNMQKRLPQNAAFIKTIVTTELFRTIVESYKATCIDVLTGFKYIAEKIDQWEKDPNGLQYIFGGEESYGYLLGTVVRDKDAISSSALICEMALQAKLQGKTLVDLLFDLYQKYGIYKEKLLSVKYPETKAGREQMKNATTKLRRSPPTQVNGVAVKSVEDYETEGHHPKSDILVFWMNDGAKVVVRPSGTEPKVKLYGSAVSKNGINLSEDIKSCEKIVSDYLAAFHQFLT